MDTNLVAQQFDISRRRVQQLAKEYRDRGEFPQIQTPGRHPYASYPDDLEDRILRLHQVLDAGAEARKACYFTVYETLAEHVDVTLANPLKLRWISEADQKTDEIDAEKLAKLHRVDMVPESYVPPAEIRRHRELTRARQTLVQERTKWKNEIHSLLDRHGVQYDVDLFTQGGRDFLDDLSLEGRGDLLLNQWLDLVDDLDEKIDAVDEEIVTVAATIEDVEILLTIPGIGPYRALVIHGELGEIERFDGEAAVVSYAGLDPTVQESGDTRKEGSISKRGNSQLRKVLVGAARTAVHTSEDPYLSEFYWRLRDGKNVPV